MCIRGSYLYEVVSGLLLLVNIVFGGEKTFLESKVYVFFFSSQGAARMLEELHHSSTMELDGPRGSRC